MQGTWAEASKKAARTLKAGWAGLWLELSLQPLPSQQLSFTIHRMSVNSAPSSPRALGCREIPLTAASARVVYDVQRSPGFGTTTKTTDILLPSLRVGVLAGTESSHCGSRDFNQGAIYRPWAG